MRCGYGCGLEAKFFVGKASRPCCSDTFLSCPGFIARTAEQKRVTAAEKWPLKPTKVCSTCRLEKSSKDDFYQKPNGRPASSCKTCVRLGLERWAERNPDEDKAARKRASQKEGAHIARRRYKYKLRDSVIEKLGGKCAWHEGCTWTDPRALQVDHVHGGGNEEKRELKGSTAKFYQKVLADTTGKYQLLCACHNVVKRFERFEGIRSDHPLAGVA